MATVKSTSGNAVGTRAHGVRQSLKVAMVPICESILECSGTRGR